MNELCLETGTYASKELKRLISFSGNELNDDEKELIKRYKDILQYIKKECIKEKHPEHDNGFYNPEYKYGIFQIDEEINIEDVIGTDKKGKDIKVRRYGDLDNKLNSFKKAVVAYYKKYLASGTTGILFDYQLIKWGDNHE